HLLGNTFEPRVLIDLLAQSIDAAVKDGYEGLCATGDMRWEFGTDENFDRILEYEARLEQLFHRKPLRGVCQYHKSTVPSHAIRHALTAHPGAYIGGSLNRENMYYMPPEFLLDSSTDMSAKQGDWMCQQILRVLQAEEERNIALEALKQSEARQ